jgi:transposase
MDKIRTKKGRVVNEKTLLVTVDIGKVINTGYWRCSDKTEGKPFCFHNNFEGFNKFLSEIINIRTAKNLECVVVGFESTGSYAEPLMHFLRAKGVKLVQVNPLHTKKLKDLQGNSPNKTDRKDPKVIADIIELGHALTVIVPEGVAADLRRLTHARERALQRKTALLNQLQDAVFVSFPEFLDVMKGVKTKTAHFLLKHYPMPSDILECGLEPLAIHLKEISRGKLGHKRAQTLYEAAKRSVGIKEGSIGLILEIRAFLSALEQCNGFLEQVEYAMGRLLKKVSYSRLLLSIKGIGPMIVAGLIGEVGDFKAFGTIPELLKCAGLNLYEISSGKRQGARHISKRGRALMRKLLFYAALCTVRKGGIMHEHYQRHLQNGMKKMKALVAISRKLLGIMFALVRDHKPYLKNHAESQYLNAA